MANTCFNTIRIEGPAKDLESIKAHIDSVIRNEDNSEYPNGYGLFRLLLLLGYKADELMDTGCRDEFYEHPEIKDGILHLSTESAWCFQDEGWKLVKRKYPKNSIYYVAEEFGCDVFETNDTDRKHFKTRYALDWGDESGDGEVAYFDDTCSLIEYVHDQIDSGVGNWQEMKEALEGLNDGEDSFPNLHTITYDNTFELI